MQQLPQPQPKRVPLGEPIDWTDADLDQLAEVKRLARIGEMKQQESTKVGSQEFHVVTIQVGDVWWNITLLAIPQGETQPPVIIIINMEKSP